MSARRVTGMQMSKTMDVVSYGYTSGYRVSLCARHEVPSYSPGGASFAGEGREIAVRPAHVAAEDPDTPRSWKPGEPGQDMEQGRDHGGLPGVVQERWRPVDRIHVAGRPGVEPLVDPLYAHQPLPDEGVVLGREDPDQMVQVRLSPLPEPPGVVYRRPTVNRDLGRKGHGMVHGHDRAIQEVVLAQSGDGRAFAQDVHGLAWPLRPPPQGVEWA
jgi:hypothetical protein